MTGVQGQHDRVGGVGLPEVIGFALGAGAMAKALVVLEANLSGSEGVRRLFREGGLRAEFARVALRAREHAGTSQIASVERHQDALDPLIPTGR
jgi:hypothetical protein